MAKRAMAEKVTESLTIPDHAKVSPVAAVNYDTFRVRYIKSNIAKKKAPAGAFDFCEKAQLPPPAVVVVVTSVGGASGAAGAAISASTGSAACALRML